MTKLLLRTLPLLACLVAGLGAPAAHAARLEDVFGRGVPPGEGRPALVLYANRATRPVLRQHAFDFAYRLRDERPVVVVHVDLRDVPGLFKARARAQKRYA